MFWSSMRGMGWELQLGGQHAESKTVSKTKGGDVSVQVPDVGPELPRFPFRRKPKVEAQNAVFLEGNTLVMFIRRPLRLRDQVEPPGFAGLGFDPGEEQSCSKTPGPIPPADPGGPSRPHPVLPTTSFSPPFTSAKLRRMRSI